jgi:hypothetical protein
MNDDPLEPHVQRGEIGEDGAQRPAIAAAFGVPLAAAEGRALPPGDAARVVEERGRPGGPSGVGDRLVAFPARDQCVRLPGIDDSQDGDQETRRDSGHGIPREHAESHARIYGRERVCLAEIS